MFGFVKKALMRLARAILQEVIGKIQGLVNKVLEAVLSPVQAIIQEIVGGVWKGAGANAFVDELTNILIPDVEQLIRSGERGCQSMLSAAEIMTQADKTVSRMADGWLDTVASIY